MESKLRKDLIEAFPCEFETILGLIDKALESDKGCFLKDGEWSLSLDVEKQHALQFYYYMALSKPTPGGDDIEINVSYENGINNGTQIIDYCLEGSSLCTPTKEINVIVGITPDWKHYENQLKASDHPGFLKRMIKAVIECREKQILELYKNQNYDNYVTGGGSNITDKHYKSKFDELRKANIFWVLVHKVIEVDRAFV